MSDEAWVSDARKNCEDGKSTCNCPPCQYCDLGFDSAPCTCGDPHRAPCYLPMALDQMDSLRTQLAQAIAAREAAERRMEVVLSAGPSTGLATSIYDQNLALRRECQRLREALEAARDCITYVEKDGKKHSPDCIGKYGYPCKAWCDVEEVMAKIDAALSHSAAREPKKEG